MNRLSTTILAVTVHFVFEWLFFLTKPSFLTGRDFDESAAILASALLLPFVVFGGIGILCATCGHIGRSVHDLLNAALIALWLYTWFGNFLQSVLGVGPLSSGPVAFTVYSLFFLLLVLYWFQKLHQRGGIWLTRQNEIAAFLLLVSGGVFALRVHPSVCLSPQEVKKGRTDLPNIMLLSSDALSAERLGIYGAERDTTPYLRSIEGELLVFENAFANANRSAGSIASFLTGKEPMATEILTYPDIVTGRDAYEHLPGLLRKLGYRTMEIGSPLYADFFDLNFRDAFDEENYVRLDTPIMRVLGRNQVFYASAEFHFLLEAVGRAKHLLLGGLSEPEEVRTGRGLRARDEAAIERGISFVRENDRPVFIHLHLLATHGPDFQTESRTFTPEGRTGSYDDAIRDFDGFVRRTVSALAEMKELDRTVLIVHTDHDAQNITINRIPLIFRIPGGRAGRVSENAQLLDIAPTLLDLLEVEKPGWMRGASLLDSQRADRPIFGGSDIYPDGLIFASKSGPYRHFEKLSVVMCDRAALLRSATGSVETMRVPAHTAPCSDEGKLETPARLLTERLAEYGFPQ